MDTGDKVAFSMFAGLIFLLISIVSFVAYTDEFTVDVQKECVKYNTFTGQCVKQKKYFSCRVTNGETRYICDTAKECNTFCEKERNK